MEKIKNGNEPIGGISNELMGSNELKNGNELISELTSIYNHLSTNSNKTIVAEIVCLISCKIYDEICNHKDSKFKAGAEEPDEKVAERIRELFEKLKTECHDVFRTNEKICLDSSDTNTITNNTINNLFRADEKLLLDDKSIAYVVRKLQNYNIFQEMLPTFVLRYGIQSLMPVLKKMRELPKEWVRILEELKSVLPTKDLEVLKSILPTKE